jgi:hypothetical protein
MNMTIDLKRRLLGMALGAVCTLAACGTPAADATDVSLKSAYGAAVEEASPAAGGRAGGP